MQLPCTNEQHKIKPPFRITAETLSFSCHALMNGTKLNHPSLLVGTLAVEASNHHQCSTAMLLFHYCCNYHLRIRELPMMSQKQMDQPPYSAGENSAAEASNTALLTALTS